MNNLVDVRGMSVNEYCDYVESRALHLGVSPMELNMEYRFERGVIGDEMYERAKWELNARENERFEEAKWESYARENDLNWSDES